jgi:hypothetical protein
MGARHTDPTAGERRMKRLKVPLKIAPRQKAKRGKGRGSPWITPQNAAPALRRVK